MTHTQQFTAYLPVAACAIKVVDTIGIDYNGTPTFVVLYSSWLLPFRCRIIALKSSV